MSSPSAASYSDDRDATVTRRLDFAAKPSRLRPNGPGKSNGVHAAHANIDEEEEEDVEEEADAMDIPGGGEELDDDDEPPEPLDDEEVEEEVPTPPRSRGRKKLSEALPPSEDEPELFQDEEDEEEVDPVPVPKAKKNAAVPAKPPAKPPPAARGRKKRAAPEIDTEEKDGDEQDQRQAKRPRGTKQPDKTSPKRPVSSRSTASVQPAKPRGRPRGRPKKTALAEGDEAGETSFMALQKGPPLPKRRGLVSVHHDPDAVHQTRSGRHSYRPLGWWKGEQVVTEDESRSDMFTKDRRDFVLGSVKEIIRVPEDMAPSRRAPRSKTRTKAKARGAVEAVAEDEELEPWETYPGTIDGEIIVWEPEHELQPPADEEEVQIVDEQIAVSADALQTKDIKDASFRFAKTLTTPFMGAGIVDLPPGTEKRPKNSRKMHMVFFVHYGKVAVTVNDVHFRISAGGQWFVPRGEYPFSTGPLYIHVCLNFVSDNLSADRQLLQHHE
jgi:centromere protein C